MFIAAIMDYVGMKVKNELIVVGIISGFVLRTLNCGFKGFENALLGMLVPVIILWIFFVKRWLGAADVKLFCMIGTFLGVKAVCKCIVLSFVIGALIALAKIIPARNREKVRVIRFAIPIFVSVVFVVGGFY